MKIIEMSFEFNNELNTRDYKVRPFRAFQENSFANEPGSITNCRQIELYVIRF